MDDNVTVKFGAETNELESGSKRAADAVRGVTDGIKTAGAEAGASASSGFSGLSGIFTQLKDAGSLLANSLGSLVGITHKATEEAHEHGAKMHEAGEGHKYFSEAAKETQGALNGLGGGFSTLGSLVGLTTSEFVGLAAAFVAFEAIKDAVKETHEYNQELRNLSQLLGINGTEAAGLSGYFAELGMAEGSAEGIAAHFTRTLQSHADAFEKVGVEIRESNGNMRPFNDILFDSINKLKEYKAGTDQNAVALQLFGRSFREITPLLYATKEGLEEATKSATDLGLGLTNAGSDADREYTKAMAEAGEETKAFKKVLAESVMPSLIELAHWFKEEGPQAIATFKEFVDKLVGAINFIAPAVKYAMNGLNLLAKSTPLVSVAGAALDLFSPSKNKREAAGKITDANGKPIDGSEPSEGDPFKPVGGTKAAPDFTKKKGGGDKDTGRARYAIIAASLKAELDLLKEHDKEEQELEDDKYKHNLISIQQYYADKTKIEQEEADKAIASKKEEIAEIVRTGKLPAQGTPEWDRLSKNDGGGSDNKQIKDKMALMAQEIKLQGELAVMEAQRANISVKNNLAMVDAEQKRAKALAEVRNAQDQAEGNSDIADMQANLNQRKALQEISNAEYIRSEVGLENERTRIAKEGIEARRLFADNDPVEIAKINSEIEQEERNHQSKLTDLTNQGELERQKYALQATNAVETGFSSLIENLANHTGSLKSILLGFADTLAKSMNKIAASMITENLFGPAAGVASGGAASGLSGFFSKLLGGGTQGAADAGAGASVATLGTAATATSTTMATLATAAQTAASALMGIGASGGGAGGAGGLGGILSMFGGSGGAYGASDGAQAAVGGGFQLSDAFSSIPSFAVGTDSVPNDMLAYIHKGEKITPSHQNKAGARGPVHMTNNFVINGPSDVYTQQQIADAAGRGMQMAVRRNS